MDSNITVLMAGNPETQSGESMLLNINQSPLKSEELGKIFYDYITSDYYIELKHGAEYITYTYVMNPAKVHSQGANRPGVFWIGVTIPRGKQIRNPYDLIIELRDKFQKLYMTQRSDGSYEFHNVPYDVHWFKTIVNKYELVDLQSSYVQMTGEKNQPLSLNSDDVNDSAETKIRKFFDDTQYIEFEDCSSVIVAEQIEGTSLLSVEVPHRPGHYVVKAAEGYGYIKSSYNGDIIDNKYNTKFKRTFCKNDYYETVSVSFKISDIDNQKVFENFEYVVDKKNRFILVKPKYIPKKFKIGLHTDNMNVNLIDCIRLRTENDDIEIKEDISGYFVELYGENVKTQLSLTKIDQYDICDYSIQNPQIDKDTITIDISVIENSGFNGVRISNIPDDIDRKLILTICKNEHTFEIENNYKKSNYQVEIGEIEKRISAYRYIRPDDISDCLIKSKRYYYNFSNRNYIKRIGWLVFEQKN